ncbi:MAG: spermine synthase, partial [Candidatus Omnitrophica bacterium]|nr:spermine synthase [Candidatus Omnitrophota bacterium]
MSRLFIFCVGVIGLSGLAAQVLLLRELLVSFYGNELTVGIVLANWLITESAGVYCAGRLIDRHKHKMAVFLSLELLFSAAFAFCIYFARVYKDMLGIPTGEGIGLTVIFWASLAAILPVSFIHGALFTTACRLYPDIASQRGEEGIGKVYAWETVGMIAGGVILTYLFLPFLTTFHSVFIVIVLNLLVCVLLLRTYRGRVMRLMVAACIACAGIGAAAGSIDRLHQESVRRQFKQGEVLDYRNSVYGNVAVTRSAGQYTFFSNGLPVITTPVPDITFAEDFANLGLAFHHRPRRVLIAGAGAGGLLHEVLKHPVERVDYLELDPLIITMVAAYATPLTQSELNDPRTRVHNLDARFFLSAAGREYDMILIGLSDPADLATNRLFTREFFSLARERLLPRGIITFWLPGSLSYLSEEMTALHAGILTALEDVFPAVRVIPGDYTIFL